MADKGKLEKVQIQAFKDPKYKEKPVSTWEAYVNPNEITLSYEIEWDSASGSGTTASRMNFKKMKPGDMSLTFFLDGTGANGKPCDVQQKVEEFQAVTLYNGKHHRTNY